MPKLFGKELSNSVVALGGIAGVVVLGLLISDLTSSKEPTSSRRTRKIAKASEKKMVGPVLESDYKAKFAVLTDKTKDAFTPLVVRKTLAATVPLPGMPGAPAPNLIPAEFTGGETTWAFTGSAEVNGVQQALLENSATGDSIFLSSGATWRKLKVSSVKSDQLIIVSNGGQSRTIPVGDAPTEQPAVTSVQPGGTIAPVDPSAALRGAIGGTAMGTNPVSSIGANGLQVQPDASIDPTIQPNNGRQGRRRQRRGQTSGN